MAKSQSASSFPWAPITTALDSLKQHIQGSIGATSRSLAPHLHDTTEGVPVHMPVHMLGPPAQAELLSTLAATRARPSAEWWAQFQEASLPNLASLSPSQLAELLVAGGQLQLQPTEEWLAAALAVTNPSSSDAAKGDGAVELLCAIAAWGLELKQDWLAAYLGALVPRLPTLKTDQLPKLAWALTVLGAGESGVQESVEGREIAAGLRREAEVRSFEGSAATSVVPLLCGLARLGCLPADTSAAWLRARLVPVGPQHLQGLAPGQLVQLLVLLAAHLSPSTARSRGSSTLGRLSTSGPVQGDAAANTTATEGNSEEDCAWLRAWVDACVPDAVCSKAKGLGAEDLLRALCALHAITAGTAHGDQQSQQPQQPQQPQGRKVSHEALSGALRARLEAASLREVSHLLAVLPCLAPGVPDQAAQEAELLMRRCAEL